MNLEEENAEYILKLLRKSSEYKKLWSKILITHKASLIGWSRSLRQEKHSFPSYKITERTVSLQKE
jgi:hypothetical protein